MAGDSLDAQLSVAAARHAQGAEKRQELRRLEREVARVAAAVADLAAVAQKEEADVQALESSRLRLLGYALLGSRQRHLDQERSEAQQAEQDLAAARQQLDALTEKKDALQGELADDDELYLSLVSEKSRLIEEAGGALAAELAALQAAEQAQEAQGELWKGLYALAQQVAGALCDVVIHYEWRVRAGEPNPWDFMAADLVVAREGGPSRRGASLLRAFDGIAQLQAYLADMKPRVAGTPTFRPALVKPGNIEQAIVDRDAMVALLRHLEHDEKAHAAAVVAAHLATQAFLVRARV